VAPRIKLGLVFLVCAAPVVLGWLAYEFGWGVAGGGGNYGELIAPRAVAGPLAPLKGKWVLVTFDASACDSACEKKLYIVRQVRKAQGKDAERIERLWVITDGSRPRPELLAAIEGAHTATGNLDFPGERFAYIYLVDPLGNLMMRFPKDADPGKMIKDLQRLLRYSSFG
jgi:cytochrome oxidase Cu insertion factor (SCO1/SenC/PrrC family)